MTPEPTVYQFARALAVYIAAVRNQKSATLCDVFDEASSITDWIMSNKIPEEDE